jgi:MoaA/NifB/PqqE/SkfB family radical SAM enzyme
MKNSIHIELTNRCRISCPKCIRTILVKKGELKRQDLSLEACKKYAESLYESFMFCGTYGDPIYHPQFLEIVKLFKDNNKVIKIHTNGSGKALDWWKTFFCLLKEKDEIIFSLDGLRDTAGLYRINISPEDHDQIIEVMKLTKNYKFKSRWVFIPFKTNEHQIEEAKQLASDIGITFELKKSSRWDGPDDPYLPTDRSLISSYSKI